MIADWLSFLFPHNSTFSLHWPWLLCLLPMPWLAQWVLKPSPQRQSAALFFPTIDTLLNASQTQQPILVQKNTAPWWLWCIWILLVLAGTRPQWIGEPISIPTSGRDLLLVVDLSPSMQTEDMDLNGEPAQRIDAIKKVVGDFVQRRAGDRLGLVLFASKAYLQTPLTFDHTTLTEQLQEAQLGFAGEQTAIGDGIALSAKRLEEHKQKKSVMILLTDGANTTGALSPLQGAEIAKAMGIKIYTVGIGADEMTRRTFFGVQTVNPSSDLDEKTLTTIAQETGGSYFRARNTEQLNNIYHRLDELEPVAGKKETLRPVTEWFYWPLTLALLMSFLIALLAILQDRFHRAENHHAA